MKGPDEKEDLGFSLTFSLRWLIRLRWLAAAAVIVGAIVETAWLEWYQHDLRLLLLGVLIFCYNTLFWWMMRLSSKRWADTVALAWVQIAADLVVLSALVWDTGGTHSPLLSFFVFHMVFASLLLSPTAAYACATAAMLFAGGGLIYNGHWPTGRESQLILAGWALTLYLTIYLTGQITLSLRRHRYRLIDQNRRVRHLANQLKEQQMAMIQHEKSVAMGHMAAGVAHEIANPLASMDGVLQLMQRHERHMTADKIATLRHQIDRVKVIVRQMTDFAHPTDYRWKVMPINAVVELGLQMIRFDHRLRQVKIEKHLEADRCPVNIQPHAVQQVLVNVLLNAMDALVNTQAPQITITTECHGDQRSILIQNNGPGIAPEHLDELFEPFFTTKPVGKGTGLGLAIGAKLMRNQGGHIEVVNHDQPGTTFRITLPPIERQKPKKP